MYTSFGNPQIHLKKKTTIPIALFFWALPTKYPCNPPNSRGTSMSNGRGFSHCASGRDGGGGTTTLLMRMRRVPRGASGSLRGRMDTVPREGS